MLPSIHPRIRIGAVLIASFLISGVIIKYTQETPGQKSAPQIQVQNIVSDFSASIVNSQSGLLATIQSIHLPSFALPTATLPPGSVPTEAPQTDPEAQPTQGWITLPTSPAQPPTSTPNIPQPTSNGTQPTSSIPRPTSNIPSKIPPTDIPKPTKTPKPTAVPPIPAWTEDVRPGTSIEEILREVSKRVCIPYALLMATRTVESGAWMNNMSATTTKKYNTYGWWKSASSTEICAALAYYTQSGLVPPDSGGGSCTNGVQPGAYDQKIMGLMQVSEWEEDVTRKNTVKTLSKNIDRRVLFDNAVIYAWATKGRAGNSPQTSCDDWPQETVKLVAEKHYGACAYSGGNYCTKIWELYKSFK